jgi:hypothetical protein
MRVRLWGHQQLITVVVGSVDAIFDSFGSFVQLLRSFVLAGLKTPE